ncbi:GNAT family N-acetyltransferase [Embleya hyalina]|uniref:N-acetyltransferase n=1 Tax=Embleya hyalina TaxID=516124 RepID=A0A401Z3C9_9ACTN|nr:N-acetyltransferase [Embleya hyalina]
MDIKVEDVPALHRFEARVDGALAGFAEYMTTDTLIVFTHTEVDPGFEGKGVGGTLVRGALDLVRAGEHKVLPLCPFVKAWIGKHPDYFDLVYDAPPSKVTD